MAARAGMNYRKISKIESSPKNVTLNTLTRLALALNRRIKIDFIPVSERKVAVARERREAVAHKRRVAFTRYTQVEWQVPRGGQTARESLAGPEGGDCDF